MAVVLQCGLILSLSVYGYYVYLFLPLVALEPVFE